MSWVKTLGNIVVGTGTAAAAITALPVLGAAGTITTAGVLIAGAIGTGAAVKDKLDEDEQKKRK
ncbi:MAG: hypothetical protein KGV46_00425 [Pasteurella sp.]|nr:hypothetical protein [Pasteurella sp.]